MEESLIVPEGGATVSKTIVISLSDDAYQALHEASSQVHRAPEELAADAIADRFVKSTSQSSASDVQRSKVALLALMRARGLLVDPSTLPPYPGVADLPPRGSAERARLEEEVGRELNDALDRSGKSIADLVER